jgi:ribonucleoside-diphosphate reductase alpha chain
MNIFVTKRDGTKVPFDANRINRSLERACEGFENKIQMVTQIATETQLTIYDGISEREMDEATINTALQNVSDDPAYDTVATRLLLKMTYARVLGDYDKDDLEAPQKLHASKFASHINEWVDLGLLDKRMQEKFDLVELANTLDVARDDLFGYTGLSGLLHRYALKGKNQESAETPQYFFMRVAMGMSYNEADPTSSAKRFYNKMSKLEYIAGGSTNLNAGVPKPALSNCFLMEVQDSMEHIAKSVADVMMLSKASGGIGMSLTKLRASGSPLTSSNTVSSGPTPFAKIIDTAIRAVQRGGKKKGALCFYMENWHIDFPDYMEWRQNSGDDYLRMRTADTAVFISDEFMKRVQDNADWYMFDPKETADLNELYGNAFSKRYQEYCDRSDRGEMRVYKKVKAREQYRQILAQLQGTSHPWLTWKDTINNRALNNNTGTIHMSNLCTEICLPQDKDNIAVCNLASLNLAKHVDAEKKEVQWQKLEETVRTMIRHLDNLVDINVLPIPEAEKSDKENRAVGLGVMGFADAVEKMGWPYDCEEAYDFTDKVFEFISYMAIDESTILAQEKGAYKNFPGSGWSKGMVPYDSIAVLEKERGFELTVDKESKHKGLDWDVLRAKVKLGMRNATLMAVAPNANIGLVANTTPGIDARFAQIFSRNKISGKYLDINVNLVNELKKRGLWERVRGKIIEHQGDIAGIAEIPDDIKVVYKTSFTTSPYAYVEVAARAQKWIDQALSRNMYLETRDNDEIMNIYTTAWLKGVKTTYYLHMKPRHTAEQSTTSVNKSTSIGKTGFGAFKSKFAEARQREELAAMPSVESPLQVAEPSSVPTQTPAEKKAFVCPVDPAERAQCDSCQ